MDSDVWYDRSTSTVESLTVGELHDIPITIPEECFGISAKGGNVWVVKPVVDLDEVVADIKNRNLMSANGYLEIFADQVFFQNVVIPAKSTTIFCRELVSDEWKTRYFQTIYLNPDLFGGSMSFTVCAQRFSVIRRGGKSPFSWIGSVRNASNDNTRMAIGLRALNDIETSHIKGISYKATSGGRTDDSHTLSAFPRPKFEGAQSGLIRLMRFSYLIARKCAKSHSEISYDISHWVLRLSESVTGVYNLRQGFILLLSYIVNLDRPINFVPYLDQAIYERAATQLLDIAEAYEDKYDRFVDRTTASAERQGMVNLMLQEANSTVQYLNEVSHLSQSAVDSAQGDMYRARRQCDFYNYLAGKYREVFKKGIEVYKAKKAAEAALSIFTAILTLGISVASVAVGNPAGAAGAAGAATQVANAANQVANTVRLVEVVQKVVDMVEKLRDVYTSIAAVQKSLEVFESSESAVDDLKKYPSFTTSTIVDADWEAFALDVETMMKPAIDEDISGAEDYAKQLKKMAIWGKTYLASYSAFVSAKQAAMRDKLAIANQKRIATKVGLLKNTMAQSMASDITIQMHLRDQFDILKAAILMLIENQVDGYRYWALDSNIQFPTGSFDDSVLSLKRILANVTRRRISALTSFNPRPQGFHNIVIQLDSEPGFLDDLHKNAKASVTIGLKHRAFINFERVRVKSIGLTLNEDAVKDKSEPYYVYLKSLGVYQDRWGTTFATEKIFTFVGTSYVIGFGGFGSTHTFGGDVGRTKSDVNYFEPTPFSTWEVNFELHNSNVDVTKLKHVSLAFSGNAIMRTHTA